jgi:Superfamily II DNA and RNA helicases
MRYFTILISCQIALTLSFVPNYNRLIHGSIKWSKVPNKASCTLLSGSSPAYTSNAAEDPLERTKKQLETLSNMPTYDQESEVLYRQLLMKPANALKEELKSLKLQSTGRKPDLARRLVDYYTSDERKSKVDESDNDDDDGDNFVEAVVPQWANAEKESQEIQPLRKFAGLSISNAAGSALARAGFTTPTPIQVSALPLISKQKESLILHAETGSGKTLCYLLPITERAWRERDASTILGGDEEVGKSYALVLTPTRELAAQVAGVATCLAPPGTVRLVTTPTNLVRESYEAKERSEGEFGGRFDNVVDGGRGIKIIVGSAKSIFLSLFGDSKLYPPTSKPEAKTFLSNVNYLVLDEVGKY